MTAIELLAAALPAADPPEAPEPGICCVLGTETLCVARKRAIKDTFTNLDLLRAPSSDRVSVAAWRVLTEPRCRKSSWVTYPGLERGDPPIFRALDRQQIRALIIDEESRIREPWAGYVTTSWKKHGALRAPVNTGGRRRWIFEVEVVDCTDAGRVAEWWLRILTARTAGIPRPVIESLDIGVSQLRKHFDAWRAFEPWARERYRSGLYRLLTFLLPSEAELKVIRGSE